MTRNTSRPVRDWIGFTLLMAAVYLALQSVISVAHEFTHSTTAWLLGYIPTPFTVIWGDPLTMRGWDEGVPYHRLFPVRGIPAEAAIGGMPLLMHAVFVVGALYLLLHPAKTKRPLFLLAIYWFIVMNLAELVAYILMRPFIPTGDTGHFNAGLGISPWFLFLGGTAFLVAAWWALIVRAMPTLDAALGESHVKHRIVVWLTAFFMFLWSSGLRIMSLYPDRQWKFGLVGIVGFFGWILVDHLRSSGQT